MPLPLPATRWALTPPFHPHPSREAPLSRLCRSLSRSFRIQSRSQVGQFVFCGTICPPRKPSRPMALKPSRRPGNYPALRSHEPGLSSAKRLRPISPKAFRDGGAARLKFTLQNPPSTIPCRLHRNLRRSRHPHPLRNNPRGRRVIRIRYRRRAAQSVLRPPGNTERASSRDKI